MNVIYSVAKRRNIIQSIAWYISRSAIEILNNDKEKGDWKINHHGDIVCEYFDRMKNGRHGKKAENVDNTSYSDGRNSDKRQWHRQKEERINVIHTYKYSKWSVSVCDVCKNHLTPLNFPNSSVRIFMFRSIDLWPIINARLLWQHKFMGCRLFLRFPPRHYVRNALVLLSFHFHA